MRQMEIYELFPYNYLGNSAFAVMCQVAPPLCEMGINIMADEDVSVDNQERIPVFMGHYPAGTSLKSVQHFG